MWKKLIWQQNLLLNIKNVWGASDIGQIWLALFCVWSGTLLNTHSEFLFLVCFIIFKVLTFSKKLLNNIHLGSKTARLKVLVVFTNYKSNRVRTILVLLLNNWNIQWFQKIHVIEKLHTIGSFQTNNFCKSFQLQSSHNLKLHILKSIQGFFFNLKNHPVG